jgi:hypothetical protein
VLTRSVGATEVGPLGSRRKCAVVGCKLEVVIPKHSRIAGIPDELGDRILKEVSMVHACKGHHLRWP